MTLMGRLGLSSESSLEEGTPDEVTAKRRRAYAEKLRPARLKIARHNPRWTEIADDFVPRGRGFLVSAATDHVYTPVRGVVFLEHSVNVIADHAPLYFTVDANDELTFYERQPWTWTAFLEKRAARELAKAVPKPRRVPAGSLARMDSTPPRAASDSASRPGFARDPRPWSSSSPADIDSARSAPSREPTPSTALAT